MAFTHVMSGYRSTRAMCLALGLDHPVWGLTNAILNDLAFDEPCQTSWLSRCTRVEWAVQREMINISTHGAAREFITGLNRATLRFSTFEQPFSDQAGPGHVFTIDEIVAGHRVEAGFIVLEMIYRASPASLTEYEYMAVSTGEVRVTPLDPAPVKEPAAIASVHRRGMRL